MEAGSLFEITTDFAWKININRFEEINQGAYLSSPKFYTKSVTGSNDAWEIRLYPKGASKGTNGYLSLYLNSHTEFKRRVNFTFSLLNSDYASVFSKTVQNHVFSDRKGWGFLKFVTESFITNEANAVVDKNNELTIMCKVIVMNNKSVEIEQAYEIAEKSGWLQLVNDYDLLVTDKLFKLTLNDGRYFEETVMSDFRAMSIEPIKNVENSIKTDDAYSEVLHEIIRFIHTCKIDYGMVKKRPHEFLSAAEKYSLLGLKLECEAIMSAILTLDTAVEYLLSSITNKAIKLRNYAEDFICSHWGEMIVRPELHRFAVTNPELYFQMTRKMYAKS